MENHWSVEHLQHMSKDASPPPPRQRPFLWHFCSSSGIRWQGTYSMQGGPSNLSMLLLLMMKPSASSGSADGQPVSGAGLTGVLPSRRTCAFQWLSVDPLVLRWWQKVQELPDCRLLLKFRTCKIGQAAAGARSKLRGHGAELLKVRSGRPFEVVQVLARFLLCGAGKS